MHNPSPRKIFQGVANRHDMFRLFDRHRQAPTSVERQTGRLYGGEWFEIGQAEHDYMFNILPPLFMRGDMFALREYLTGSITSVFFSLSIDGRMRWFHAYCDLSDRQSPDATKAAIIERESRPVRAMSRAERLEHIWSITHDDYRGYAGKHCSRVMRGKRTVLVYGGGDGTVMKVLDDLADAEISAKLPVHLRFPPDSMAA